MRLLRRAIRRLVAGSPVAPVAGAIAACGPQIVTHALWLNRTQWASADRMRGLQARRLREIVAQAHAHSPFYRRKLDAAGVSPREIQSVDDLVRLPVLTRREAEDNAHEITSTNASSFRARRSSTSGSSGSRLEFLRDRSTLSIGYAALSRFLGWHGIPFGHRIADFRIFRDAAGAVDSTSVLHHSPGMRRLDLNLTNTDPGNRARVADALAGFKPDVIKVSSPTWMAFLSMYLLEHKEIKIRPRLVVAGCERLFPEQRDLIAQAFQAPVAEFFGNEEFVIFAGDCEHSRLHLAAEMGVVEILVDRRRCPPDTEGDVVVTSLWNRAFPFIRYGLGDLGLIRADRCPCGRTLPVWRIIGGRERDLLATPDGYVYLPVNVTGTPRWRGKVAAIRFYQENRREVVVQVVRGPDFAEADAAALGDDLTEHLRGLLRVSLQFVDGLEQTAGGKYRMVVSRVPPEA
jgi:phenylacetate-CoA ligase